MVIDYHTMPLKALRNRIGLNQTEVANIIGVTQPTLVTWEKDSSEMPAKYLDQLSELYAYPRQEIYIGPTSDLADAFKAKPHEYIS